MSKFFMKKKVIIIMVAAIVAIMVGLIIGTNIVNTMKAKEKVAEKAKIEKTIEERKEIEKKIKKVESGGEVNEEDNYSEEYKEYLALSDEEKKKVEAIPRKEKIDYSELETIKEDQKEDLGKEYVLEEDKKEDDNKEVLPKKFNLKDKINVVVESQGSFGLCWDFASVKSLETNLALTKGEYYDISESHIDYMTSKLLNFDGRNENSGGSFGNVKQYNEKNKGFVLEEEVPLNVYEDYEYNTFYYTPKENIYITKYAEFPTFYRDEEMSQEEFDQKFKELQTAIKTHIMNYGSIYASITAPDFGMNHYMKDSTDVKYSRGSHAVSIVGWDDDYSRNNFKSPNGNIPEKDGAYIALNSWGDDWGDGGYFYISYEDFRVHSDMSGIVSVNNLSDFIDISKLGKEARKYVKADYDQNIVVIDGKEYLRKDSIKTYIDLSNRNIDIDDLEEFEMFLKKANSINLSNNRLESIVGLEKYLKDGVRLNLSDNNIKDVSSLKDIKFNLLNLDGNNGVIGYDELNIEFELSIANCGITSTHDIDKFKDLRVLNLSGNEINDYSGVENLKNLFYLELSNNGLKSLEPLKDVLKMESLYYINLSNNNLKDISGLEESSIYEIRLSNNTEISNFEPIRKLKDTYYIMLDGCNIKDAKDVYIESVTEEEIERKKELMGEEYYEEGYYGITYDLSNNKGISNIGALKNASELVLKSCDLTDISELKDIKNLCAIDLSHNHNLTGDLSGMNLGRIILNDCNLDDDFDLFSINSVQELNIGENDIKSIDKFVGKVEWIIFIDSYDGEKEIENGPYISTVNNSKKEIDVVIEIPDERNLTMNLVNYMKANKCSAYNIMVNGKYNNGNNIIPISEDTEISYTNYEAEKVKIRFKVNRNIENTGIEVRYNPYMARLKNSNTIDKNNLVVAKTYGNAISKETTDFNLTTDIYVLRSRVVERQYERDDKSYIWVPEKYYSMVTQGDHTSKYTVGKMSGYNIIEVNLCEDLTPPDDFEEEFPTLRFDSEELYNIAKDYWDGLYVRADDDLLTIELKEYRERNDSGLPMYIPRRLLWDADALKPVIVTDIYILMDEENGMDRIGEGNLKDLERLEQLENIHIITPPEEYNQDDLIVPQDKYTIIIENGVG